MDSNTKIGKVSSFLLKTEDGLGNTIETTLNKNLIPNQETTYQSVDTAMRALVNMSSNTYADTICVTNISVNEVLAG